MLTSLRAPALHGEILIHPAGSLSALARENESALAMSLGEARAAARAEILPLAQRWTSGLVEPLPPPSHPELWVVGGHQPELFHPGVWVKNAVVSRLAERLGGVGLHLVVDNDLCTRTSVRVPLAPSSNEITSLHWDTPRPQVPWEERPHPDEQVFSGFGQRCGEHLKPWGFEPLAVQQDWKAESDRPLVDRLVLIRNRFERTLGVRNLELKVSDLSETVAFRSFIADLLGDAPALWAAYQRALNDYRQVNHIRSSSHPVPDLVRDDHRIEVPLWIWRANDAQRGRVYVQLTSAEELCVYADQQLAGRIPRTSASSMIDGLQSLQRQGWKIRPRALTLTLFCRMYLGSIFVHGIGGAKYDEMTDDLIRHWLQLSPPTYVVATATLRLFERFAGPSPDAEISQLQRELRAIQWNPEWVKSDTTTGTRWEQLRADKRSLLQDATQPRRVTHERLREINSLFRPELLPRERATRERLQQLLDSRPAQTSMRSREFASNLFPRSTIEQLFQGAWDQFDLSEGTRSEAD